MKKFWLTIGLALILACWCGGGYYGLGTGSAFGQYYDPRGLSCNPSDPYCYNDYHSAPYADPNSQFLYYVAPPIIIVPDQRYERGETKRERGDRQERKRDRDRY